MHGVSTRAVDDLVRAMGGSGISKSQVSRLVEEIDERVNAFLNRPIEGEWPYVWIDATYLKARQAGRVLSTATIIAVGVNTDGRREVLGVATGPSEAETFWKGFLRSLADRGLAASSWSSPTITRVCVLPPRRSSMPACSAAASTGCAMRSPMCRPSSAQP